MVLIRVEIIHMSKLIKNGVNRTDRQNRMRYQNRKGGRDGDDDKKRNNQNQTFSKRGEHVINNVVRLYTDIVKTFVKEVMRDNLDTMIQRYDQW